MIYFFILIKRISFKVLKQFIKIFNNKLLPFLQHFEKFHISHFINDQLFVLNPHT